MKTRSQLGWLELVLGLLFTGLGVYTFVRPFNALTGIAVLYGIIALVSGIIDVIFYVKMEKRTGFGPGVALVTGILGIIAGVIIIFNPGAGQIALAILFPIWFIAHCISGLSRSSMIRFFSGSTCYYFSIIINILGLCLGIMMLFDPITSLVSVGYIIGFYLLLLGIDSIIFACTNIGADR